MGKFRFILGAMTGAAAALLLAPRSGKETRQLLSEKLEDAAEYAPEPIRDAAEDVMDAAGGVYDRVATKTSDVAPDADDIKAKIAQARDALAEQITRNHAAATTVDANVEDLPVEEPDVIVDMTSHDVDETPEVEEPTELENTEAVNAVEEPTKAEEEPKHFTAPDWYK